MAIFKPVFLLFFFFSFAVEAAIIPYLNKGDWLAALPAVDIVVEDFNGSSTIFLTNSSDNFIGSISVSLIGGIGDPGPTGLTGKGYFQGEVDSTGDDKLSLNVAFDAVYGFALEGLQNDSLSSPGKLSLADIAIGIGSEFWVLKNLLQQDKTDIPFLGFVSNEAFESFEFLPARSLTNKGGTSEEFYLDQLTLAQVPAQISRNSGASSTVPEPPVISLLLIGLLGVQLTRKYRHRAIN